MTSLNPDTKEKNHAFESKSRVSSEPQMNLRIINASPERLSMTVSAVDDEQKNATKGVLN